MDLLDSPMELMSLASIMLLLLLNSQRALSLSATEAPEEDEHDKDFQSKLLDDGNFDEVGIAQRVLQQFSLWNTFAYLDDELGYWVKPRSTTWFSRFILQEYDDDRWVQMFRFTKRSVFSLAEHLAPAIKKNDTNYRLAIPVLVRLACTLFKLSHGASLLICSELFAVGRSTVSNLLRDVVHAINDLLRGELTWPSDSENLESIAAAFQQLSGLPGVLGAIDATHIAIAKPRVGSSDYFYFKSGGYSINCQAVVDSSKRFLDLYVGMPGSTNDSRVLRRSTLYRRGQRQTLWDAGLTFHGFSPFLLGDAGYPLLPWLMVPHHHHGALPVAAELYNRRLSRGRGVVENAFALLKLSFRELHTKTDLDVAFVPDVVTCCAILHNVLLKQSHNDVERLLEVVGAPRSEDSDRRPEATPAAAMERTSDMTDEEAGMTKRQKLSIFLSLQRLLSL